MEWFIHYADRVVSGGSAEQWRAAPDDGVQVVAAREPFADDDRGGGGWIGVGPERRLWTGEREYDPFGFGVKRGSAIPDDDYWRIWTLAAYDGDPPESERLHPARRG